MCENECGYNIVKCNLLHPKLTDEFQRLTAVDVRDRANIKRCVHYYTRKRFSEKTIVAFTNSRVFILDFYIYDYM